MLYDTRASICFFVPPLALEYVAFGGCAQNCCKGRLQEPCRKQEALKVSVNSGACSPVTLVHV